MERDIPQGLCPGSLELWGHTVTRFWQGSEGHSHHRVLSRQSVNENDWLTFVPTEKSMTGDWFLEHRKLNMEETSQ